MLPLLLASGHALEAAYSLQPPFERTDVSEIGNWSVRGSAVSWKNAVRLTSDALREEWGAVCQRAPTAFKQWSIDIELSSRGAELGGEGITFLYSDSVCPQNPTQFNGFAVTVDTANTDRDGYSPIKFSEGSLSNGRERSRVRIRNLTDTIKLLITKTPKHVSVEYTTFMRYIPLFSVDLEHEAPDYGYFTIFAVASAALSDNVNVHGIRTRPHGEVDYSHISAELIAENRKILESDALKRREAKRARREALLPTTYQYLSLMEKSNNSLSRASTALNMRDAFCLVEEASKRGMEAVTIDMLKVFINRYLQQTLAGAGSKVSLAMDRFDDARGEMTEMWEYLRQQLMELAVETKARLQEIADQSVHAAKGMGIRPISQEAVPTLLTPMFTRGSGGGVLIAIMVVELIAYVIFFAVKHRQTRGFKKVD
jgi:hypothetical protein